MLGEQQGITTVRGWRSKYVHCIGKQFWLVCFTSSHNMAHECCHTGDRVHVMEGWEPPDLLPFPPLLYCFLQPSSWQRITHENCKDGKTKVLVILPVPCLFSTSSDTVHCRPSWPSTTPKMRWSSLRNSTMAPTCNAPWKGVKGVLLSEKLLFCKARGLKHQSSQMVNPKTVKCFCNV